MLYDIQYNTNEKEHVSRAFTDEAVEVHRTKCCETLIYEIQKQNICIKQTFDFRNQFLK